MLKFSRHILPELEFKEAIKRPLKIRCVQIGEDFEVETMEGVLKGKKGDWLMVGVEGEVYPCENSIFRASYDIVNES
jgi:hypothetical protein